MQRARSGPFACRRIPASLACFYSATLAWILSAVDTRARRLDNSRLYGSFNFLTLRDRAASGLNDGHYSHCLHVDRPSGRQARWETLQLVVSATGDPLTAENHRLKVMFAAADNNRL